MGFPLEVKVAIILTKKKFILLYLIEDRFNLCSCNNCSYS